MQALAKCETNDSSLSGSFAFTTSDKAAYKMNSKLKPRLVREV